MSEEFFWKSDDYYRYQSRDRFSLLVLAPGEIYFEDFSVFYYPVGTGSEDEAFKRQGNLQFLEVFYNRYVITTDDSIEKQKGRLKLCSRSLVFEPLDTNYPILKLLFKDTTHLGKWSGNLLSRIDCKGDVMIVESKLCIQMKESGIIGPYKYIREKKKHLFSLNFGNLSTTLPMIEQLYRASTLNPHDEASMIATIVQSRQARINFNTSWIEDLYEKIVLETTADKITPLVCNPGKVLLTSSRLYFQPFNNVEPLPVIKLKLSEIKRVTKRRYLLRHVGLEIYSSEDVRHLYLVFDSRECRDDFYNNLMEQDSLLIEESVQENMTLKWQTGAISNYDYLLYLNSQADRSFNDLTQYPVFPWIISDYESDTLDLENPATFRDLSKPIGAMDQTRLDQLKTRSKSMPDPKFLYGSHYSTPGFVLYYLVRVAPEYMLCLQNGKFDKPDRLFHNIKSCWDNCCTGHSDFKEKLRVADLNKYLVHNKMMHCLKLKKAEKVRIVQGHIASTGNNETDVIDVEECENGQNDNSSISSNDIDDDISIPEFYDSNGAFLENKINLNLGIKQDGTRVDDVILPPWAQGAQDFIKKSRDALECPFVSENIHHWIDLIFGYKQTGEEAWKANNVFYYLTYEGAVDLDAITNPNEKESLKQQILEFGQTPKQLFTHPHPHRKAHSIPESISYKDPFIASHEQFPEITDNIPVLELQLDELDCKPVKVETSLWHGLKELEISTSFKSHKDAVLNVAISHDQDVYYSVSQDTQLKINQLKDGCQVRSTGLSNMALSSCVLMPGSDLIVIGSWDNFFYLYSVEYGRALAKQCIHEDAVSAMCWKDNTLVTASWDSTVKVWQFEPELYRKRKILPELKGELDHDTEVQTLSQRIQVTAIDIHIGKEQSLIVSGTKDVHTEEVVKIQFSPDGQRILSCSKDQFIKVLDVDSGLEIYSKDVGDPIMCATSDGQLVVAGLQSGEVFIWDLVATKCLQRIRLCERPIRSIDVSGDSKWCVAGVEDGHIFILKSAIS
eukprot:gene18633-20515_t